MLCEPGYERNQIIGKGTRNVVTYYRYQQTDLNPTNLLGESVQAPVSVHGVDRETDLVKVTDRAQTDDRPWGEFLILKELND